MDILCVFLLGLLSCAESQLEAHQTVSSLGTWLFSSRGSTLVQQHCQRTGHDTPCDLHSNRESKETELCCLCLYAIITLVKESKQMKSHIHWLNDAQYSLTSSVDASVDLHLWIRGDHAGPPRVGAHLGPHQISNHKLFAEARLLDHWWMMDLRNLNINMNESQVWF